MKRIVTGLITAAIAVGVAVPAEAAWNAGGSGGGRVAARAMPSASSPTSSVSGRNITVTWSESSISGTPVGGYMVRRYGSDGTPATVGTGCSGIVTTTSCTEQSVAPGTWLYRITTAQGMWRGDEGGAGNAVTVGAPAVSLTSSATITSLPSSVAGTLNNYITGETIIFRLDDAATGQVLTGSATIGVDGSASFAATIPVGVANGAHTIYAIGSAGSSASASVVLSLPTAHTIATSAYDLRDASSGTESDQTNQIAFADSRTATLSAWGASFASNRYMDFRLSSPLQNARSVSGVGLNFRFSSTGANTTCFYFEVRRASTTEIVSTHGSSAAPAGCATSTTMTALSIPLPAVTTTGVANDLLIRAYGRNSASAASIHDLVSVTGTLGGSAFTLYTDRIVDSASGTATTYRWSLAAADATNYLTSAWSQTFAATRYLRFAFPGYTPSDASSVSATFEHAYRSETLGTITCYYFEVYSGTTLIGTHGSATQPLSCNSTVNNVTHIEALPEVNTPARANNVSIKMFVRNSGANNGARRTLHDSVSLKVTYTL